MKTRERERGRGAEGEGGREGEGEGEGEGKGRREGGRKGRREESERPSGGRQPPQYVPRPAFPARLRLSRRLCCAGDGGGEVCGGGDAPVHRQHPPAAPHALCGSLGGAGRAAY